MPGVLGVLTGDDVAADKVGGLICGWMIHSKDGSPMKAGAASGAGAGQGALCRRPCRGGRSPRRWRRRRTRPRRSTSTTRCCRPWSTRRRRRRQARRWSMTIAPDNTVYRLAARRQGGDGRGLRGGEARHQDRPRQQPAGPERDGAARRDRRIRHRARTASRSTPRARTRMSRGWCCRPSSASRPSTSCASSRPMSAAASARRSSSMPRRRSASGRRRRSAGR